MFKLGTDFDILAFIQRCATKMVPELRHLSYSDRLKRLKLRGFRVTSWFDTVNNAVTRWMNFRENHLHEHDLFDYNI